MLRVIERVSGKKFVQFYYFFDHLIFTLCNHPQSRDRLFEVNIKLDKTFQTEVRNDVSLIVRELEVREFVCDPFVLPFTLSATFG